MFFRQMARFRRIIITTTHTPATNGGESHVGRPQLAKSSAELPPVSAKSRSRRGEWRGPDYLNRITKWFRWDRHQSVLALSTLGVAVFAILFGLSLYGFSHGSRIYEGVRVAGVD